MFDHFDHLLEQSSLTILLYQQLPKSRTTLLKYASTELLSFQGQKSEWNHEFPNNNNTEVIVTVNISENKVLIKPSIWTILTIKVKLS